MTFYHGSNSRSNWTVSINNISPKDLAPNAYFGSSISLFGGFCVVGAYLDTNAGSVYIYQTSDDGITWSLQSKLTTLTESGFGYIVRLFNTVIAIGSYYLNEHGYNNDL